MAKSDPHAPGLRFDLGPEHPELEIKRVIAQHVGAEQAITIAGIAQEQRMWPSEWWFVRTESHGFPHYVYRATIQRAIKRAVRRLRRQGVKIASRRGDRPGYFMIQTPEELAKTVAPLLRQALDELKTIEALTGREYYVRELAGQMKLFQTAEL
jgi:hypothetical protein